MIIGQLIVLALIGVLLYFVDQKLPMYDVVRFIFRILIVLVGIATLMHMFGFAVPGILARFVIPLG
jgi:cytochrome c biogenesis protein CcdA